MLNNLSRWASVVAAFILLVVLGAAQAQTGPAPRTAAPAGGLMPDFNQRARISFIDHPFLHEAVADPAHNRLYVASNVSGVAQMEPMLFAIDTLQGRVIHSAVVPNMWQLVLSQDGLTLFGFEDNDKTVHVYDAARLTWLRSLTLTCLPPYPECYAFDAAAGPQERLYWLDSEHNIVNVMDTTTGAILHQLQLPADAAPRDIEIAGPSLFVSHRGGEYDSADRGISRYNIAAVAPVLEHSAGFAFEMYNWRVAPDGRFLLAGGFDALQQVDADTLSITRSYSGSGFQEISHSTISAESDRIIYNLSTTYPPSPHENLPLRGVDAATGEIVITGLIDRDINYVVGPLIQLLPVAGGGVAAVFNNTIYLFSPMTHAAAVPVVLANHCPGGAILDDFSDVNSGWPSGVTDDMVFGYVDNQYAIALRPADQWFAVSRGDKWIDGHQASLATQVLAGEGLSGLVFGLNDDWSLLYTLEVFPDLRRWAVFEFRADIGWTLLLTGVTGGIAPDGWNQVKINRLDDTIQLYVNGVYVGSTANRQGRIGISGGSLAPSFEARYHSYEFVGQNCGSPYRAGGVEFAPPISRPPVESFLERR